MPLQLTGFVNPLTKPTDLSGSGSYKQRWIDCDFKEINQVVCCYTNHQSFFKNVICELEHKGHDLTLLGNSKKRRVCFPRPQESSKLVRCLGKSYESG